MKQLATIFLLLIILLQTFNRLVVEADYYINIGYIVKNLCVNKEKPSMHCNGKCYLARQLKEQQKQEQTPLSKKGNSEIPLFLVNQEYNYKSAQFNLNKSYPALNNNVKPVSFPRSIFHPPGA